MSVPPDRAEEAVAGFLLVHRVAQSHLGSLWVARDERHTRPGGPALLRHVQLPDDTPGDVLQRLAGAGRAAMPLRHENVLPVLDVLQEGTSLALVYEYLEGQPLSLLQSCARARELRFSVGVSLRLMIDLLRGVEALQGTHSSGSAFGGLSPASVLVSRDGRTLLCDPVIVNSGTLLPGLECSTAQMAYMAPEQVHATAPLGPATDVFTGAAMLWELLSGRRLLSGRKETIERKLLEHDLPRLSVCVPAGESLSSGLVELLERSLARDPSRRPASPGALATELEQCGHEIASRAQLAEFVGELSGQRFVQLGAALGATSPLPVPTLAAAECEAIPPSRATAMGIGAPLVSASATGAVADPPGAAPPPDLRSGVTVLPLLPLAAATSLPPLPLIHRRAAVAVASTGSLQVDEPGSRDSWPRISVREWKPSEVPRVPSLASKRALLFSMALVILGAQLWVFRLARSHAAQPSSHESNTLAAEGSSVLQVPPAAGQSGREPEPFLLTDAHAARLP